MQIKNGIVNGSLRVNGTLFTNLLKAASLLIDGNIKIDNNAISYINGGNEYSMIRFRGGDANGHGISIGGGGNTIIGCGESAASLESAVAATEENLYLISDNNINFITNAQTFANRLQVTLDTGRNFYPSATQTGSIGTSGNRWASFYGGSLNLTSSATIGGNILMTTSGSYLHWNTGTFQQRLITTDDSTANTGVFSFQQSEDTASSWKNLLVIYDNGNISLNNKMAIKAADSWLRINEDAAFSSGTYFGSTIVRTDGTLQNGSGGANFYANASGNGYFRNTLGIAGTNTEYKLYVNGTSLFAAALRVQYATPNLYIKDTSTAANTYSIIRFGNSANENAAYIFLNGASRTDDGGANLFTIRNNVGNLRLNNNVINTGNLTVGIDSLNTSYKLYINGTSYLNGAVTVNGLLTTTFGASHKGIKVGNTYINAINGELILQNNTAIRFGTDSWDYNEWAGLKYVHGSKAIYLGLADGTNFTANSAQSGGILYIAACHLLPTVSNTYDIGSSTYQWRDLFLQKKLSLNRSSNTNSAISYYSPSYYTWHTYMTPAGTAGPNGTAAPSYGNVTTWALRQLIENVSGYGWTWESATNSSGSSIAVNMALSSQNGNLYVKGTTRTPSVGNDGYISYISNRYNYTGGSKTGYIKITLPTITATTMMQFTVNVYNYVTNTSSKYIISGYKYNSSTWWYNTSAICLGGAGEALSNLTVRFGASSATNHFITIGETNTTWSYPVITISDITVGQGNIEMNNWSSGWNISIETAAFADIIATRTNTHVGYGSHADTVDGQHFTWSNSSNSPTYLWATNSNGSAFLCARASMSVNYANSAGNSDTLDGYHFSDLESRYVNISGDTMSGRLNFANNIGIYGTMGGGTDYWNINGTGADDNGILIINVGDNSNDYIRFTIADYSGTTYYPLDIHNNYLTIGGNILSSASNTYTIGSSSNKWKHLYVGNRVYLDEWIQFSANTGLYWPNNNGAHWYPNNVSTYGTFMMQGTRGGYAGIMIGPNNGYMTVMSSGTHHGLYHEGKGRWLFYHQSDSNYYGIGTTGSSSYTLTVSGSTNITSNLYVNGWIGSGTRIYTGYDSGVTNSISCSNWFRSNGSSGWYNATYGGGWYMTDSSWVRSYNNKGITAGGFYHTSYGDNNYLLTAGGGAIANTSLSYEPRYATWVDASGYSTSTYYPVTIPLTYNGLNHIKLSVQLNGGGVPSWSTHSSGFTVVIDVYVIAAGWGTVPSYRYQIVQDDYSFANVKPAYFRGQLYTSSEAVFYVRGGGKYKFIHNEFNTPTLRTSTYGNSSYNNTCAPTTSTPPWHQAALTNMQTHITGNCYGNLVTANYGGSTPASGSTGEVFFKLV